MSALKASVRFEKNDRKLNKINDIVLESKNGLPIYADLAKAAQKWVADLAKAEQSEAAFMDTFKRIIAAPGIDPDIKDSLRSVLDVQKTCSTRMKEINQSFTNNLLDEFVNKESGKLARDKDEITNFEKNHKAKRAASIRALKKAEATAEKANKKKAKRKYPERARDADAELEKATQKHHFLLIDELRKVALAERKKAVHFLCLWSTVINTQISVFDNNLEDLMQTHEAIQELTTANEVQDLSQDILDLIEFKGEKRKTTPIAKVASKRGTLRKKNKEISVPDTVEEPEEEERAPSNHGSATLSLSSGSSHTTSLISSGPSSSPKMARSRRSMELTREKESRIISGTQTMHPVSRGLSGIDEMQPKIYNSAPITVAEPVAKEPIVTQPASDSAHESGEDAIANMLAGLDELESFAVNTLSINTFSLETGAPVKAGSAKSNGRAEHSSSYSSDYSSDSSNSSSFYSSDDDLSSDDDHSPPGEGDLQELDAILDAFDKG
eukprot:CAMPEP_0174254402 /NCGR_PEP_ID=MMETSP0439-20130205/3729_1 /TAXON_ID=0 /ORGANISM="Stereomyxa ramosa, Strain Chinc5" /LENGTH=496 /DNA_ID=CAMNT_0015335965 /DNA_START=127 /DNA_END=1617 /DNA_ORIENTATION=-